MLRQLLVRWCSHSCNRGPSDDTPPNSAWLPLCNDGRQALNPQLAAHCWLNIQWSQLTLLGALRVCILWTEFVSFTAIMLMSGVSNNTRFFALNVYTYFMMSFIDPSRDDFQSFPSAPVQFMVMVTLASVCSIAVFWLPDCQKRFTALDAAGELAMEASVACGLLVESTTFLSTELMCQKAASALEETRAVIAELEEKLEFSWFEDFGWDLRGCCGRSRYFRRQYRRFATCARASIVHISSVHFAAASLTAADWKQLSRHASHGLSDACLCAGNLIVPEAHEDMLTELKQCLDTSGYDFEKHRLDFSSEARAFLFVIYGVLNDVRTAVEHKDEGELHDEREPYTLRGCCRIFERLWLTIKDKFHLSAMSRDPTNPRFVIRNTISISIAFGIGWHGVWNVLPSYSFFAAGTIGTIVYTYTGSSTTGTIRRICAIVLGKVGGCIIQLAFACKSVVYIVAYALSMFGFVTLLFSCTCMETTRIWPTLQVSPPPTVLTR